MLIKIITKGAILTAMGIDLLQRIYNLIYCEKKQFKHAGINLQNMHHLLQVAQKISAFESTMHHISHL